MIEAGASREEGITPAYAGTTRLSFLCCCCCRDHPRLRGNYVNGSSCVMLSRGSPPLTRELPAFTSIPCACNGITPAYAGTTSAKSDGNLLDQDHPRLRGNYSPETFSKICAPGSPPLTRELPMHRRLRKSIRRITPAYAGTTRNLLVDGSGKRDHPRLRGNYFPIVDKVPLIMGSPPLTRELLDASRRSGAAAGITPAYAGTTRPAVTWKKTDRDHPRLRGNYNAIDASSASNPGSPPLTRELRFNPADPVRAKGITPAYAGTTLLYFRLLKVFQDHPRLRGNYCNGGTGNA